MESRKLNVLLIEDDLIEVMKLQRSIKKLGLAHNVMEAKNGEDALEQLMSKEVLPDIILLDLNMPKISGLEFLRILKADPMLKYLPVIILTTSENRTDLRACYEEGIAGYILKPLKYEDYLSKIDRTLQYWSVNELIKS